MKYIKSITFSSLIIFTVLMGCEEEAVVKTNPSDSTSIETGKNDTTSNVNDTTSNLNTNDEPLENTSLNDVFGSRIDLSNLPNYSDQSRPAYIRKDNTAQNEITNAGAVLGRVLFYDVKLSSDNTISCASCHKQSFAFGDTDVASKGVNGTTGRHSMRLVNARFAEERNFFWDERANSLEAQTTMPIQDHIEMGYSGEDGDQNISDLINKLYKNEYYRELFAVAFGDDRITETRMQQALAQFVRSIQSFDAKYDQGRAGARTDVEDFSNFSAMENLGKSLFIGRPQFAGRTRIGGGLGCGGCHRAPEFDIDPQSRNNGVVAALEGAGTDVDVTRAPSLRDIINPSGSLNGGLMHTGSFNDVESVLDHYNQVGNNINNLDMRLRGQNLSITNDEKEAIVSFLKTLTGSTIYTDEKWSSPFE